MCGTFSLLASYSFSLSAGLQQQLLALFNNMEREWDFFFFFFSFESIDADWIMKPQSISGPNFMHYISVGIFMHVIGLYSIGLYTAWLFPFCFLVRFVCQASVKKRWHTQWCNKLLFFPLLCMSSINIEHARGLLSLIKEPSDSFKGGEWGVGGYREGEKSVARRLLLWMYIRARSIWYFLSICRFPFFFQGTFLSPPLFFFFCLTGISFFCVCVWPFGLLRR